MKAHLFVLVVVTIGQVAFSHIGKETCEIKALKVYESCMQPGYIASAKCLEKIESVITWQCPGKLFGCRDEIENADKKLKCSETRKSDLGKCAQEKVRMGEPSNRTEMIRPATIKQH